ncbi:MAG: transcription initiation factor IIB [Desulfurococcales archaeon]|nr:transcription initiation factor IIB [Desulfurococcales archaeon]MCE4605459.1 transcription initiation factor IIB [Desulfurococcales archaeon]
MAEDRERESTCPPDKIIYDPERGVRICELTGEVIEEGVIGDEAEWRAYTPEEKSRRTRVGGPVSWAKPHMGIDAYIGTFRRGGGQKIKGVTRRIEALRVQRGYRMGRTLGSLEKNINQAMQLIDEITAKLSLPSTVKEEAAKLYREAAHKGLTRGRSIESMVAAVIYAACRSHQVPCTLDELSGFIKMKEAEAKREVARNYRLLVRDLEIRIPVIEPERFVYRIASALNLPDPVVVEAIKIVKEARKRGLTAGKDPSGLAAAAVYLAALKHGLRKTQKEVASVAGVTEVTVRNRYKEIAEAIQGAV